MREATSTIPYLFAEVVGRLIPGGILLALYFPCIRPTKDDPWLQDVALPIAAWLVGFALDVGVMLVAGWLFPLIIARSRRECIRKFMNGLMADHVISFEHAFFKPHVRDCIMLGAAKATMSRGLCAISAYTTVHLLCGGQLSFDTCHRKMAAFLAMLSALLFCWIWRFHQKKAHAEFDFAKKSKGSRDE